MPSNQLINLQQCENKFNVVKNEKGKYYLNYDGKPLTLEIGPSDNIIKNGFYSFV
jgi:hypothetical protein